MEKEEIRKQVEAFLHRTDQYIVDIRLSPAKLAVFVDKPDGITLDECAALSRHLTAVLEPAGFLDTHELEVSSPGIDMPLLVPQQYRRRIGSEVRIFTTDGKESKGILRQAGDTGIELMEITEKKENKKKVRMEEIRNYSYDQIRETKLILNFKFK
jgi:ribosome maturation factor RimP